MEHPNQAEQNRRLVEQQIAVLTATVDTVFKARNTPIIASPKGPARILANQGERLVETPTETGDSAYAFTVLLDDDPDNRGYRTWTWRHDSKDVHQVSAINQSPEQHEDFNDPYDIKIVQGRIAQFIDALPEPEARKKPLVNRVAGALGRLMTK